MRIGVELLAGGGRDDIMESVELGGVLGGGVGEKLFAGVGLGEDRFLAEINGLLLLIPATKATKDKPRITYLSSLPDEISTFPDPLAMATDDCD